jgi:hypothetical protein
MSLNRYFQQIQKTRLDPSSKARIFDAFYRKKQRVGILSRWLSYTLYGTWVMGAAFVLLIVLSLAGRDGSPLPWYKAIVSNQFYTRYVPAGSSVAQAAPLWYLLSIEWDVTFSNENESIHSTTKTINANETIVLSSWASVAFLIHPATKAQIIGPAAFQLLRDGKWEQWISSNTITLHVLYGTLVRVSPYLPTTAITNPGSTDPFVVPSPSIPKTPHHLIVKTQDLAIKSQEPHKPLDVLISVSEQTHHSIHNAWWALVLEKVIDDAVVYTTLQALQSMTIQGDSLVIATPKEAKNLIDGLKDQSLVFSFPDIYETDSSHNTSTTVWQINSQETQPSSVQETTKRVMSTTQHELFTQWVSPHSLNGYIHRIVTTYYNGLPEYWQRIRELGIHIQALYTILELSTNPDSITYYNQAYSSLAGVLWASRHLIDRIQEEYFIGPTPLHNLSGLVAWLSMLSSSRPPELDTTLWLLTFEEIIERYDLSSFPWYLILR